ncbi:MAG TPA: response regulator transcription factor [Bacteroidota bacterium]|nr:response regulator transcription factor [Bacteroidota bacterium]
MERIRVLIADDHRDFRRVVHEFLDRLPNVSVVGEAKDGDEAVKQVEKLAPDVVLMDIAMPNTGGLEATRIIKERWPQTKVLLATMYDNPMYRTQARKAKADGFFLKSSLKPSLDATFGPASSSDDFWNVKKKQSTHR